MSDYRLYRLDKIGHFDGSPDGFRAENDDAAIQKVGGLVHKIASWKLRQLVRVVYRSTDLDAP
jgi:hypothetical protein